MYETFYYLLLIHIMSYDKYKNNFRFLYLQIFNKRQQNCQLENKTKSKKRFANYMLFTKILIFKGSMKFKNLSVAITFKCH
jgi:hypothetical protein